MGIRHIKSKHLVRLGYPKGEIAGLGLQIIRKHFKHATEEEVFAVLEKVLQEPGQFLEDAAFGTLAEKLMPEPEPIPGTKYDLRDAPQSYNLYGIEHIDEVTQVQMDTAMKLPVAVRGALMPDAHKGYGLPVGGVLATQNAVIPYAVGMDIGCRMCLSVFPLPATQLQHDRERLTRIVRESSRFGKHAFDRPMDDPVLDRSEFGELALLHGLKDTARYQIGTSGSGNHFVEFGAVRVTAQQADLRLAPGEYLGLLTHSGSRAFGATIADHYSRLARQICRLPRDARRMAWLDLDSEAGQEYWLAMNLAGDYASACHAHIHQRVCVALAEDPLTVVENHHNFAWQDQLEDGTEVIVHRKGATPAHTGELGIIPGSMIAPGFVVRGKGNAHSLQSASHGAGRRLSRKRALNTITRSWMKKQLEEAQVTLIGGSTEEAPNAYKDIRAVMAAQRELVEVLAEFHPQIVRMDR
ncbi:MAG: RtcB family protein [Bacteroidota bacterium]